jgi:hypothetical protein
MVERIRGHNRLLASVLARINVRHRQSLPLGARVEQQLKLVKRDGLTEIIDTPLLSVTKLVEYGPKAIIIDRRRMLKNAFSLVAFSGCKKVISTHADPPRAVPARTITLEWQQHAPPSMRRRAAKREAEKESGRNDGDEERARPFRPNRRQREAIKQAKLRGHSTAAAETIQHTLHQSLRAFEKRREQVFQRMEATRARP